jgi:hypothetical protein
MFKKVLLVLGLFAVAQSANAAICVVTQYQNQVVETNNRTIPVALEPSIVTSTVTYTSSSGTSAFHSSTNLVRIVCNAKAHFKFSTTGTNATANDPWVTTDAPEYFGVPKGQSYLVEFYDGST